MKSKQSGRRRFLKNGVALASLAVGAMQPASGQAPASEPSGARPKDRRAYGQPSHFENVIRTPKSKALSKTEAIPNPTGIPPTPPSLATPIQDLMGVITPAPLFFDIGPDPPPDIDPRQHRLLIHGMVDRPLILTMEELKRLPSVTRMHYIECGGNGGPTNQPNMALGGLMTNDYMTLLNTHGSVGCCEWTGVPLSVLFKEVGVQKGASWFIAESADAKKHTRSIPVAKAMDDGMLIYGQNGEAIRPEQGYPLRLLLPGWEGNTNVKWLRRIKLVDQPAMTRWEATWYPSLRADGTSRWFQFEMGVKSVITFPSVGQQLPGRGFYEIRGLAWSGGGSIRRVEVSTDGGKTWKDAQLQEPVHRKAFTQFRLPWNWDGEELVLQSRCTDDTGDVQPTLAEFGKRLGINSIDYWQTSTNVTEHFNAIQPWRVTRDGKVHNALLA